MLDFLLDILKFDSTSGSENELARHIAAVYTPRDAGVEIQKTPAGRLNLFFKYGEPKIIFCSHLDTVPPYIPPDVDGNIIRGRGTCDAKGQLAYLFEAFKQLHSSGNSDIGMLMLSGEEDGSQGAIRANKSISNTECIIIGEPTENKLIKASKGILLAKAVFKGKSCHSGYPGMGDSAFTGMLEFFKKLEKIYFENDDILGETTYNTGSVYSNNASNVVPDLTECKILFRTTFASAKLIKEKINNITDVKTELEFIYEDEPMTFTTFEGFETGVVSYGTDAPAFTNIKKKILYGPGSILDAHTENEKIKIDDLYKAVEDIKFIYGKIKNEN